MKDLGDLVGLGGDDGLSFRLGALAGAGGAAYLARKGVTAMWKVATGNPPPANPEDPDVTWPEAVGWALLSGAAIGLARLVASRQAAAWYRKSTGRLPSHLQESST